MPEKADEEDRSKCGWISSGTTCRREKCQEAAHDRAKMEASHTNHRPHIKVGKYDEDEDEVQSILRWGESRESVTMFAWAHLIYCLVIDWFNVREVEMFANVETFSAVVGDQTRNMADDVERTLCVDDVFPLVQECRQQVVS